MGLREYSLHPERTFDMPWIIQPGGASPWGEDQTKHLATPKYTEWEERWKVWAEERRATNKVDAQSVFIEELDGGAPVQKPENLPRTIRWKKRGRLKDCVSFLDHFVLSTRVREMIEELEPGVHEFFRIEMENIKTGEIWPEPFWLLHVRNKIDSIDEDRTHSQRSQFVFRADAIKDVHLWKDSRNQFRRDTFASDHFVSELERRGIEGIGVNRRYSSVSDNKGRLLPRTPTGS